MGSLPPCDDARLFVRRDAGVTYYECALPLTAMREHISPGEGREFCFALLVHDPDGTGFAIGARLPACGPGTFASGVEQLGTKPNGDPIRPSTARRPGACVHQSTEGGADARLSWGSPSHPSRNQSNPEVDSCSFLL